MPSLTNDFYNRYTSSKPSYSLLSETAWKDFRNTTPAGLISYRTRYYIIKTPYAKARMWSIPNFESIERGYIYKTSRKMYKFPRVIKEVDQNQLRKDDAEIVDKRPYYTKRQPARTSKRDYVLSAKQKTIRSGLKDYNLSARDKAFNRNLDSFLVKHARNVELQFDLFGLKGLGSALSNSSDTISKGMDSVSKSADNFIDVIKPLVETITKAVDVGKAINVMEIVTSLYILYKNRNDSTVILAVLLNYASKYDIMSAFNSIKDFVNSLGFLQSWEDMDTEMLTYVPILATLLTFFLTPVLTFQKTFSFKNLFAFIRSSWLPEAAKAMRSIKGVAEFHEFIQVRARTVLNMVFSFIGSDVRSVDPAVEASEDVTSFCEKIGALFSYQTQHTAIVSNSVIEECETKLDECFTLMVKYMQYSNSPFYKLLTSCSNQLRSLHAKLVDITNAEGKSRSPPLGILISGKTEIGKSTMTPFIVRHLAKEHNLLVESDIIEGDCIDISKEAKNKLIYPYDVTNDFYDNYKNQFAINMDDFGQMIDSQTCPNKEFYDVIRIVNDAPMPMHSAHLAEKGKVFCTSKVLICTSNKVSHKIDSIVERAAVYRRFGLIVEMKVKSEFATETGSIDFTKSPAFSPSIYEFDIYNKTSLYDTCKPQTVMQKNVSFDELINLLRAMYGRCARQQSKRDDFIYNEENYEVKKVDVSHLLASLQSDFQDCEDEVSYDTIGALFKGEIKLGYEARKKMVYDYMRNLGNTMQDKILWFKAMSSQNLGYFLRDYQQNLLFSLGKAILAVLGFVITYYGVKKLYNYYYKKDPECGVCIRLMASKKTAKDISLFLKQKDMKCNRCSKIVASYSVHTKSVCQEILVDQQVATDEVSYVAQQSHLKQLYLVLVNGKRVACTFCVKGRVVMFNTHVWNYLKNLDTFEIQCVGFDTPFTVNVAQCTPSLFEKEGHESFVLVGLPGNIVARKDVISHFISRRDYPSFVNLQASLLTVKKSGKIVFPSTTTGLIKACDHNVDYSDPRVGDFRIRMSYSYNMDTESGDCGSLLMAQNTKLHRKIVGIHAFGSASGNGATAICQEDIIECMKGIDKVLQIAEPELPSVTEGEVKLGDSSNVLNNVFSHGTIEDAPTGSSASALRPSPLVPYIEWKPKMAPSVLYDPVCDPMWLGLKKVTAIHKPIPPAFLNRAVTHYFGKVPQGEPKIFTLDEANQGDGGLLVPMNRSSSAGYPWSKNTKGKYKYLGRDEIYEVSKEMQIAVNTRINQAKLGNRVETIWVDTMKDERRPIEKVLAKKTRVFSNGPLDYNLAVRMYFGAFVVTMMSNKIFVESCVGVDPVPGDSRDWTTIVNYLREVGNDYIAGDFSNYDGSLLLDMLRSILDEINAWYDDGNDLVRACLWEELCQGIHCARGKAYSWTHSQPSGNPLTVIVNSIMNSLIIRLGWLKITENTDFASLGAFSKFVRCVNYGDDNLLCVHKSVQHLFNQISLTEALAHFGFTYTDEAKTNTLVPFRSLDEVSFLKRGFRLSKCQTFYYSPLALDTILEMVLWNRSSIDSFTLTRDIVRDAIFELSQHPSDVYDEYSVKIFRACKSAGVDFDRMSIHDAFLMRKVISVTLQFNMPYNIMNQELPPAKEERDTSINVEQTEDAIDRVPSSEKVDIVTENFYSPASLTVEPSDKSTKSISDESAFEEFVKLFTNKVGEYKIVRSAGKVLLYIADQVYFFVGMGAFITLIKDAAIFFADVIKNMCSGAYGKIKEYFAEYTYLQGVSGDAYTKKPVKGAVYEAVSGDSVTKKPIKAANFERLSGDSVTKKPTKGVVYEGITEVVSNTANYFTYSNRVHLGNTVILKLEQLGYISRPLCLTLTAFNEESADNVAFRVAIGFEEFIDRCINAPNLSYVVKAMSPLMFHLGAALAMYFGIGRTARTLAHLMFNWHSNVMAVVGVDNVDDATKSDTNVVPVTTDQFTPTHSGSLANTSADENSLPLEPKSTLITSVGTMEDVLEREYYISSQTWVSGDAYGKVLAKLSFPEALLVGNPFLSSKMSYYRFFKADLQIRIKLSAPRLANGALYISFNQAVKEAGHMGYRQEELVKSTTCLPGVVITVASGKEAVFNIPYSYVTKAFDLGKALGSLGDMQINVIAPLSGANKSHVSVFARFVSPKLAVPTGTPSIWTQATLNSGALSTVVDKAAQAVSGAAKIGNVPILKSISNVMEGISAFTSFSKPLDTAMPIVTNLAPSKGLFQVDGSDISNNLAFHKDATLSVRGDMGYSSEDEMSFDYLFKQEALLECVTVQQTHDVGQRIATRYVAPWMANNLETDGGIWDCDYIDYLANTFELWQGTFNIRFQIVASLVHSMRLRVAIYPPETPNEEMTYESTNNVPNYIIDVSADEPDIDVHVPFLVNSQWSPVICTTQANMSGGGAKLSIFVVNPLISASSDASDVAYVLMWRSSNDLKFTFPTYEWEREPWNSVTSRVDPTDADIAQAASENFGWNQTSAIEIDSGTYQNNNIYYLYDGSGIIRFTTQYDSGDKKWHYNVVDNHANRYVSSSEFTQGTWESTYVISHPNGTSEAVLTMVVTDSSYYLIFKLNDTYDMQPLLGSYSYDVAAPLAILRAKPYPVPIPYFDDGRSNDAVVDCFSSVRELIKIPRKVSYTGHITMGHTAGSVWNNTFIGYISHLYRYHRGGVRVISAGDGYLETGSASGTTSSVVRTLNSLVASGLSSDIVPFYCPFVMRINRHFDDGLLEGDKAFSHQLIVGSPESQFIAAADDFAFSWPIAPPALSLYVVKRRRNRNKPLTLRASQVTF